MRANTDGSTPIRVIRRVAFIPAGNLCFQEKDGEFLWKIKFSSLTDTVDHYYHSPSFVFFNRRWFLRFCPNGETCYHSEDFVGFYLMGLQSNAPLKIRFSLGMKDSNGKTDVWMNDNKTFDEKSFGWGKAKCILRSQFLRRKHKLLPETFFTLTVRMTTCKEGAFNEGSEKVVQDISKLWLSGENSDIVIKVGDKEFKAHRAILGIRTPVLSAMFKHETIEKTSGVVRIDDCEPDAFEQLLHYIYTGAPSELNVENAAALYVVADKYLLNDLKDLCVRFLQDTICLDTFINAVTVAFMYDLEVLLELAMLFFVENENEVLGTTDWQMFLLECPKWASDILRRALELKSKNEM